VIQDQLNTIKQKRVQLQKLQDNLLKITKEENKLRLLIDVFSRKGLKQKLLKNYLNALSAIFKKQLLNYDNGSIEFIESKSTLKVQLYHKGKLKDFEDLSGGEKVKYIMAFHEAIALLFQKIYNLSCNIRVYDEILNNLDTVSTSEVLDSITNKLQHNKNVKIFMIDHTGLKDVNKKRSVYVCNYDNQAYFFSNLSELLAWITPFYNKNKILNSEVKYYIEQLLSLQNEQNILVYNTNVKEEKDNTVKDTFWEIF
jgi:energy-coupling factor transporter ATP-binding protein EcfA2